MIFDSEVVGVAFFLGFEEGIYRYIYVVFELFLSPFLESMQIGNKKIINWEIR